MSRKIHLFNEAQSKLVHQSKRQEHVVKIHVVKPAHGTIQNRSN